MYTPHTVTIYNTESAIDPETYKDVVSNNITILRGVFLDASKAVNVNMSGLTEADAVDLYIPFSVDARDGVTGAVKRFAGPKEYWSSEDKSGIWTLSEGLTTGKGTYFVKGEAVEEGKDFQYVSLKYDNVFVVTKVDTKDFGSEDMQHWQVGGN